MKKIAVLGSFLGANLEAIVNYFNGKDVSFTCLSDIENSDLLTKAKELNIDCKYLPHELNFEYFSSHDFDLIALSDYRSQVQDDVLKLGKFVNVHASLLPSFKGPDAIRRAFNAGVKVSGVTVHWVDESVDGGKIIAQYPVLIGNLTHFDEFEKEIHDLENLLYPIVIDKILNDEVFDFHDLLAATKCSNGGGGCGGNCSGCH